MITAALGGVLVLQDGIGVTIIFEFEEGGLQGTLDEHWIDLSRSEWLGYGPCHKGAQIACRREAAAVSTCGLPVRVG